MVKRVGFRRSSLALVATAALTAMVGCKSTADVVHEQLTDPSPPVLQERIEPLAYAEALRDPRIDSHFATIDELEFEIDTGLDVKSGAKADASVIRDLEKSFVGFPESVRERLQGFDIVLAKGGSNGPLAKHIDFDLLEQAGHFDLRGREITLFSYDEDTMSHEFGHGAHMTHPQYGRINDEIEAVQTRVASATVTIGDILGRKDLLGDPIGEQNTKSATWADGKREPRYGLPSAYACNNIDELVAEVIENVHANHFDRERFQSFLPYDEFRVTRTIAHILKRYDVIGPFALAHWEVDHRLHHGESLQDIVRDDESDGHMLCVANYHFESDKLSARDRKRLTDRLLASDVPQAIAHGIKRLPGSLLHYARHGQVIRSHLHHENDWVRREAALYLVVFDVMNPDGPDHHEEVTAQCNDDANAREGVAEILWYRQAGAQFETYRRFVENAIKKRHESKQAQRAAAWAMKYALAHDDGRMRDLLQEGVDDNGHYSGVLQCRFVRYCRRLDTKSE